MLTLTIPHSRQDVLAELLDKFGAACAKFHSSVAWVGKAIQVTKRESYVSHLDSAGRPVLGERSYRRMVGRRGGLRNRLGVCHHVYALETTWSERNGWHPHRHYLLYTESALPDADLEAIRKEIAEAWAACCVRVGLPKPSLAHGVDLQRAEDPEAYISKWGAAAELTKTQWKKAHRAGLNPWAMLAASVDGDEYAAQYRALFREYVEAFKGRRQLVFSAGAKQALGLVQSLSDEEIAAEEPEADAESDVYIGQDLWRKVAFEGELRNELKAWVREFGPDGVELFRAEYFPDIGPPRGSSYRFHMEPTPAEPWAPSDEDLFHPGWHNAEAVPF